MISNKKMVWENLSKGLCPHCNGQLTRDLEVRCTRCKFHVDIEKFNSIIAHRGTINNDHIKIRWQNLHKNLCPICDSELFDNHKENDTFHTCMECDFSITDIKFNAILADKNHPANFFNKQYENN